MGIEGCIGGIEHAGRREDAWRLLDVPGEETGFEPVLWSPSVVGYGA